jgi:hypothetical protein
MPRHSLAPSAPLPLLLALGLAACPSPVEPLRPGTVTLQLGGAVGGRWVAAGLPDQGPHAGSWAGGERTIVGLRVRAENHGTPDGTYSRLELLLPPSLPGTSVLIATGACGAATPCATLSMEFAVPADGGSAPAGRCVLERGWAAVTEVSDEHARGTFGGAGGCRWSDGKDHGRFTIADGRFYVTLR